VGFMIVVFSGTDGAGKTTQIELLSDDFKARGVRVRRLWARAGYTPIFSGLKTLLRKLGRGRLPPPGPSSKREAMLQPGWRRSLWLFAAIVDLAIYYSIWMRWLKWFGFVVLSDRYFQDSELDFMRNFPDEDVSRWLVWRLLILFAPRPQHQFLLLVSPEISTQRSVEKEEPFPDSMETLEWRYARYCEMVERGGWYVLDGREPVDIVHKRIMKKLGMCE
jgi:thymidylate kinase